MLKCACCGKHGNWAVVACIAMPISESVCWTCLYYHAQPTTAVICLIDACGGKIDNVREEYWDYVTVWSLEEGYEPARKWAVRTNVEKRLEEDAVRLDAELQELEAHGKEDLDPSGF